MQCRRSAITAAITGTCQSDCVISADTMPEYPPAMDACQDPVIVCNTVVQVERGVDGLASGVVAHCVQHSARQVLDVAATGVVRGHARSGSE